MGGGLAWCGLAVWLPSFVAGRSAGRRRACRQINNKRDLEVVEAIGERVDDVVQEDVLLLKVDVEGHEPGVIKSAKSLIESYK